MIFMKICSSLIRRHGAPRRAALWLLPALLLVLARGATPAQPAPPAGDSNAAPRRALNFDDPLSLPRPPATGPSGQLLLADPFGIPLDTNAAPPPAAPAAEPPPALAVSNYVATAFTNAPRLQPAILDLAAGDRAGAHQKLATLLAQNTNDFAAYGVLAVLASEAKDTATLNTCNDKLKSAGDRLDVNAHLDLAGLARLRNNRGLERRFLEAALERDPKNPPAWEQLLALDVLELRQVEAEEHARRVLRLDPRHAQANFILGSLNSSRENYILAEPFLRASLAARKTSDTLNELAWVVHLRGRPAEALPLAREAVALNGKNPFAWDTLGEILAALNQVAEAEQALRTALTLAPNQPAYILHLAQLLAQAGRGPEALNLADGLLSRPTELNPDLVLRVAQVLAQAGNGKEARRLTEGLLHLPGAGLSPAAQVEAQQLLDALGKQDLDKNNADLKMYIDKVFTNRANRGRK